MKGPKYTCLCFDINHIKLKNNVVNIIILLLLYKPLTLRRQGQSSTKIVYMEFNMPLQKMFKKLRHEILQQ